MNRGFPYFDFARSFILNGVGMLVLCTPGIGEQNIDCSTSNFGQHFETVGAYLNMAIANESPELSAELKQIDQQLEFHLPT